ncbi:unnamed protein product [Clavelina lepadiformis]|uniref:PDZ domain-containing protein n=1 Tax=Clavelina lepadiformis TaxID=159417 RepID=A0ABP0G4F9_CLALP
MPMCDDLTKATAILQKIQNHFKDRGDGSHDVDLQAMMSLMESPVFRQMVQLQESIQNLKNEVKKDYVDLSKIDFAPGSGILRINGQEVDPYPVPKQRGSNKDQPAEGVEDDDLTEFILKAAQGRETEVIELFKAQNQGLGFSVVGLRSEHRGDLGIFIQDIKPGGMADVDGRLKESDQILVINGQALVPTISHDEAIGILQKVTGEVKLVVARGVIPSGGHASNEGSQVSRSSSVVSSLSQASIAHPDTKWSYVETIELHNDGRGLGFGIVGGHATGGIVVKTIVENGVADRDGRLRSGDHILCIGNTDVTSMGSEQAAVVLRQCGMVVKLVVARGAVDEDVDSFVDNKFDEESNTSNFEEKPEEQYTDSDSHSHTSNEEAEPTPHYYYVELVKDAKGLGITVTTAPPDDQRNDISHGIFVKSVSPGSAADIDGRIQTGDQIIAVDGQRLDGEVVSSQQAVNVLRSTGVVVKLAMARINNMVYLEHNSSIPIVKDEETIPEFSGSLTIEEEQKIMQRWRIVMGPQFQIVVARLKKYNYTSGLGISLEGTIDSSSRPHHYIRSILSEGPVGSNGCLQIGDELLEVNENKLLGLNHVEVVVILKELPLYVQMVCARPLGKWMRDTARDSIVLEERDGDFLELKAQTSSQSFDNLGPSNFDDKNESVTSSSTEDTISQIKKEMPKMPEESEFQADIRPTAFPHLPSSSVSEISNESEPEMDAFSSNDVHHNDDKKNAWEDDVFFVELEKSSEGLGFSILDFQDPLHVHKTAVLVRSLVKGGVADRNGQLEPGDRLISVNGYSLEFANLEQAVEVLKAVPHGIVSIGVAKPKPMFRVLSTTDEDGEPDSDGENVLIEENFLSSSKVSSSSSESSISHEIEHPEVLHLGETNVRLPLETGVLLRDLSEEVNSHTIGDESHNKPSQQMEVKQIEMSGMTAIAITGTKSQLHVKANDELHSPNLDKGTGNTLPHVPPKPVGYTAPSWQSAEPDVPRPKPPVDGFERVVQMSKGNSSLGITVSPDKEGDGLIVRSVIAGGAIERAGEPQLGDMIRHVNNDSAVGLGAAQARALIRNHSMYSKDVKISYIPKRYIDAFKKGLPFPDEHGSSVCLTSMSPKSSNRPENFAALKSIFEVDRIEGATTRTQPRLQSQLWGPIQRVDITRRHGQSLGISIVGGTNSGLESEDIQGIFVKEVLNGSPVERDGRIKVGDKIFKVDNVDLRNVTHEAAVDAILGADENVTFVIQSFVGEQKALSDTNEEKQERKPEVENIHKSASGDVHVIELHKGPEGVGLSLAGNKDKSQQQIFVVGINPNGAAGVDGRIKIGDQLLEINGTPLISDNNHQLASNIIRNSAADLVFVVKRNEGNKVVSPSSGTQPRAHLHSKQTSADNQDFRSADKLTLVAEGRSSPYSDIRVIKLVKDFQGLGFAISESPRGIVVQSIAKGGTAHRDGRLSKGDLILAVDDHSVSGVSYETAIFILKQARGTVKLTVASGAIHSPVHSDSSSVSSPYHRTMSPSPSDGDNHDPLTCPILPGRETVIEINKGKAGLGVSIVGGADSLLNSVLVHTVYDEGAAAKDGRLWPGDRILSVNGLDLRHATHDEAIEVLRNTPGTVQLTIQRDENRYFYSSNLYWLL